MNYENMLWDNNQSVDRLIAKILRVGMFVMLVCVLLGLKGMITINNSLFYVVLGSCMLILLIPTLIIDGMHIVRPWVRYMSITCTVLVTMLVLSTFHHFTFLLILLPMLLATLYFDKKLGIFSVVASIICICVVQIIRLLVMIELTDLNTVLHDANRMILFITRFSFFGMLCWIEMSLMKRSSRLFDNAFRNSDELKRNRDGLDIIVDNTDILFRARSYSDIVSIILFLIKNLFETIEDSSCNLRGFVAIRERENTYLGIDENVNPVQFHGNGEEINLMLEDCEYVLPINENDDSSTVFVNKNKLTMHFYVEGQLFAFVVLHMNLEDTDEVLNKLVRVLYRNIHLAINNIKLTNDMYQTQEELVRAFSEISESKSGQTGKHIKRVSEYMKIMAEAMDLEQSEKDSLVIASMMHDIGKLLIPESIIEKPGKLTPSEFEVIKTHVKLGYKLLEYSPGRIMEIGRIIALQHHEKWDGTGYLGMKGEEIDYYSRIMAVVDVFDALMSKRSYKERWSIEDAYNEIVSQSGKHFDPSIVELFKEHFDEFVEVLNNYPDCERTAS